MSNTLAGVSYDNIFRISLEAFADSLVPIDGFTLDMSAAAASQGTTVSTRSLGAIGTVGDKTDTHTGSYSNAIDNETLTQEQVDMTNEPIMGFAFSDDEVAQMNSGVYSDVVMRLLKRNARGIANNVLDTIWAAVDTTFTAGVTVAVANFDADDMADARADFVANAGSMADMPVCVLQPTYYAALLKDNAIQDASASGLDALQSGQVAKCSGFRMLEAPSLAAAAVNNTVGFCALPEAMLIAMRGVSTQAADDLLFHRIEQHPVSGVTLTMSSHFNRDYRRTEVYVETLFGIADGVESSLRRITSA
jgi:hypothetical protein